MLSLSLVLLFAPPALDAKLLPLIQAHKGKVTVALKHLETGESFAHDADATMPTASLIKLPILIEAYTQAEANPDLLGRTLTLTKSDKVPGAGILTQHFSDGATFPVRDALRMMVVYSDNTATNMVIDQVGIHAVNDRMASLGLKETRLNSKVYKRSESSVDLKRSEAWGLGSTTAAETLKLLELLHTGKVVTPAACKAMLGHMKANDDKEMIVRFLPPGTAVAHKTGAVNASRNDAGIIYLPDAADKKKTHALALCVLTTNNEDQSWAIDNGGQLTIAKIAKAAYDHFKSAKD